jgi:glycerophosphoryl diester phosphodiesterase
METNITQTFLLPKNLYIIGHRGMGLSNTARAHSAHTLPENTLESFKQALMSGADGIEFDVFETKDGNLLVIHDDELWKNVYGIDRSGLELPEQETQSSFRVSQKNLSELVQLSVGADKQKPPPLIEVLILVQEANLIRTALKKNRVIINIDIKNSDTAIKCFKLVENQIQQKSVGKIDLLDVYFTSSSEQTLSKLWENAVASGKKINIVPQIPTKKLFGKENRDDRYKVKNRISYDEKYLDELKNSPFKKRAVGIDCVLWDVNFPLVQLCKKEQWQLHLYAPHFNNFLHQKDLCFFITYINKIVPVFLKVDNVKEAIAILNRNAIRKEENLFAQKLPLH